MRMKSLGTTAAALALGALVVATAAPADAKLKRINIGSNPAGSVYFLLAGGFAKLFQEELKIRSTAQPHAGSSVYLPLMEKSEIVLGLNSSLDSGMAVSGQAPFKDKIKNVRMIARIWILPYAYMVKENSGIKTVADLRGKRVLVNVKTNVSLGQANRTLQLRGEAAIFDPCIAVCIPSSPPAKDARRGQPVTEKRCPSAAFPVRSGPERVVLRGSPPERPCRAWRVFEESRLSIASVGRDYSTAG